ncbi:polysaccharide deacetylase family protein [Streptomyces sp. NPDC017890]|uniref:polysaccharide deacetylase family protein n=1 Tax=Streptomyces sp. NPDC017890 TaxID=3365015 RepID=UPI0037A6B75E
MKRDGSTAGRPRRPLLRAALGLLALALVALPFTAAWKYDAFRRAVAHQAPPPPLAHGAAGADAKAAPAGNAPVVLAYHDIGPDDRSRYTVSAAHFDAQLRALREAGYRTLSTREFTDFLRTGRTPAPRTVYLTFDDGTHGLWVHADRILARHRMKAAAYLITGQVGTHRPYYLSWAEIERMAGSGRWDFQAHTDLSHARAAVDAAGRRAPVLTNRLWLQGEERLETDREYRSRVAADIDRSAAAFARHGLPRPELFAYPFSERLEDSNLGPRGADALRALLREHFTATLTNSADRPLPPGPRSAAAGKIQRLEVMRDTTPAALLRDIAHRTPVRPSDVRRPLSHPEHWQVSGGPVRAGLGALTGTAPQPRGTHHVQAAYRPIATADWTAYHLRATAGRLHERAGVTITVRAGSDHPTTLWVGRNTAHLTERGSGRARTGPTRHLDPAASHSVSVSVTPQEVRVVIDGTHRLTLEADRREPAEGAGGFVLSTGIADDAGPEAAWPRFTALEVG